MSRGPFLSKNLLSPDGNEASYHHFPQTYGLCSLKEDTKYTETYTL